MFSLSNRGVAARDPSPFHPARPGTVAQQIRALVSVGLGQRHKSCHVTASRWWPLGGTWPDLTARRDFLSGWYKQTNKQRVEKSATVTNLWDDNVTNLFWMVGCCHLLSGMMMSPSHDRKIVICSILFLGSNNFTLLFASAMRRWCWGAMLRSFEIGKTDDLICGPASKKESLPPTWRIPLSQWLVSGCKWDDPLTKVVMTIASSLNKWL